MPKIMEIIEKETKDVRVKLEDLAIAKIQDYMVEAEKRMVAELVKKNKLDQDSYLLKDGSLEYPKMSSGNPSLRSLQQIKHNYNWVKRQYINK